MDPGIKSMSSKLFSDCAEDDQEHFDEMGSPSEWARRMGEEEAAGLD